MQNKGFVKFLAIALALVCIYYLSFSFVTNYVDNKLASMPEEQAEQYKDSLESHSFYLGKNLKECREQGIGLGLDLKGGMNVILEVSVPDLVKNLATDPNDPTLVKAIADAVEESKTSQDDFISLFVKAYKKNNPGKNLSGLFTAKLNDANGKKITTLSSDAEVEKALRAEVQNDVDASFNVLRTRIDRFGVVQPNIQNLEGQIGRIMIELPGVKEPERVRKLLQGSANLEFWETYDTKDVLPYLSQLNSRLRLERGGEVSDTASVDTTAVTAASDTTATKKSISSQLNKDVAKSDKAPVSNAKEIAAAKAADPLFAILQPAQNGSGCMVGYAASRDTAEINAILSSKIAKEVFPSDLRLLWGVKSLDEAGKIYELYAIRTTTSGQAPLTGDVVTESKDEFDNFGRPCVGMKMNPTGARKWSALTEANVNHCIAIVLDGLVYSAPNVNNKIDGGSSQISGNFTPEETKDLATVLQSGKMKAPAHIVQEENVGPSLGAKSIRQGFISFIVAFILLMIYMCCMYGIRPGMVANMALVLNFFFTLGILTSFKAALTLSGIAGMVLTLGMAVDANVLIYERTKEELRSGKNVKNALAAGYSNAFSAIFDSNLTSIITGLILFYFGTGPIKGFATTLIIGIVCSFFTAVWITRIVFESRLNKGKWENMTFTTKFSENMMRDTNYKFMSSYKKSFMIFGAALVVSFISFAVRGLSQSIDFTGGRNFVVQFDKEVQPEDVRDEFNSKFTDANTQVIALGTDNRTLRITTNYAIDNNDPAMDAQIESILYQVLHDKHLLAEGVTEANFIDRDNHEGGSIISSQKVGPSIAKDITISAIWSVILALIAIFIYILIRFRNVAFSVGSVIALTIDTLLIIGAYSLCYGWIGFSLEIDQTFIGAILTAIGYSINDKVVIFDRIREYLRLYPKRDLQRQFNDSLNSTLARTINTSVSTLIVLLCIFVLGGSSIRSFAFAMILGVCIGTCSSLFIASPIAYLVLGKKIKENDEVVDESVYSK
ncbi:MAG: protein translocase subunit SecDF [Bacteroidaceae bacterium]|nr:protein translocase subunit SecDF [Bacteroidaceae bacterium]